MKRKTVVNPYLPLNTYIPDGEPHVFGDRLYIYGSHDMEGGSKFCMLPYECWSAPVENLSDWKCEGIIYRAEQDKDYSEQNRYMFAPDVVQGADGRFYLYYAMSGKDCFTGPIHVAVCNTPAGQYEYYGEVRTEEGKTLNKYITFDPAVFADTEGTFWLYYGWSLAREGITKAVDQEQLIDAEMMLFNKSREEILGETHSYMGANAVQLSDDMLTIVGNINRIIPGQFEAFGTEFEGHAFFEASSMRKIGETYYFIYSSQWQHELCYATSNYPDKEFTYGGVIVSNGDIGYEGLSSKERVFITGNNHGSIAQVCITSCGLNGSPLPAVGDYPAPICCHLTNGDMPHQTQQIIVETLPHITHEGEEQFIDEIGNGTRIGYKWFEFNGETNFAVSYRGDARGVLHVMAGNKKAAEIRISGRKDWDTAAVQFNEEGKKQLDLIYEGCGLLQLKTISFQAQVLSEEAITMGMKLTTKQ